MSINNIGSTALVTACLRAIGKKRDNKFFNDPYAQWFINDEIESKVSLFMKFFPESSETVCYRSYKLSQIADREIKSGKKQIVSLGAGFDMRAEIFAGEDAKFYEVDQPSVLQFKHEVLKEHGITPCASVPCNYLEVDLGAKLTEVGFNVEAPTLFIWEGNSMYLPAEMIHDFLSRLQKQVPSFTIAFDYFSSKFVNRTSGNKRLESLADLFEEKLGVKWSTGFDDLQVFQDKNGLVVVENGDIMDIGKEIERPLPSLSEAVGLWFYCVLRTP